ncbi:MAG: hypothetical protein OES14_03825 [Nitrosopumilus sp.]|nr:hypothetical protein [Nitrosopumilus sp.]MDH3824900.1 hypothetical protein [Nitrosopumilus sp.]
MNSEDAEAWEKALISVIEKEIGPSAVQVIKDRLLEKYGTTFRQSFPKWAVVEDVLRENFGDGYVTINSKLIDEIAHYKTKSVSPPEKSEFNEKEIIQLIGDPEILLLFNQVSDKSLIIKEIIKNSKLPQTTAYRKIEKMKKAGLLVKSGFILSSNNKKIDKYTVPFKSISLEYKNGKSIFKIGPRKIIKIN